MIGIARRTKANIRPMIGIAKRTKATIRPKQGISLNMMMF